MIAQNTDLSFKMAGEHQKLMLMDLPDEILIVITSFLDIDSLFQAKFVCKHFNVLADQFIYQDPKILKGRQAVQLAASFNRNVLRRNWVKSLLVSTKFGEGSGLSRLPPHLSEMQNLEDLRLETPDCNSRQPEERLSWIRLQDMYESVFEQSSLLVSKASERKLPHLKHCTLHFVDRNVELYSLTKYASIFLHPTLRSLTLSCASTDLVDRLSEALHQPTEMERSTDLESLLLEECDIHAPSLAYLLKFPRALKSFKFSEGVRYDGLFRTGSRRMHGNVRPSHLMDALVESCADTLESLSLAMGFRRHQLQNIADPGQYLNMTKMVNLKFVEVDSSTLHLIKPRPQCDHKTWLRLPRSLETFKISNIHLSVHLPFEARREPHIPLETCIIKEKEKHGVPNLKTIIYSYDFADDDDDMNDIDDILLLGNPNLPIPPAILGLANAVHNVAPHAANQAANTNAVAGVNMGNAIAAPPNHPIHPPQPPVAGNHLPAHLTNNLNIVNPGNHNQAQQFLRQHWFTHINRSRNPATRSQRDFSHLEMSKISLLQILNNNLLPQFHQQNTRLIVDMVKLPRGFIPPYLYPEDKPTTYPSWWDSNEAKETEVYKREFQLAREAKLFERNLRAERERSRREEELQDIRRRISRGEEVSLMTPGEEQALRQVSIDDLIGHNDIESDEDFDDDDDGEYMDHPEELEADEDDLDTESGDEDLVYGGEFLMDADGVTPADYAANYDTGPVEQRSESTSLTTNLHATNTDDSGEDNNFVDAPVHWTGGI